MIKFQHISKSFKKIKALDDISVDIEAGNIVGVLGPNGAGKTTLLRILLKLINPDSGEVLYPQTLKSNFHNNIGYLPEEKGLYKNSKVMDFLKYFSKLKGLTSQEFYYYSQPLIEKLNLNRYLDQNIGTLSKGNQQKVQLLSTIVHNPMLLILDEPFTGLDIVNLEIVNNIIKSLRSPDRIILLSTHLIDFAEILCDRVIFLNNGKLIRDAAVTELKNDLEFYQYEILTKDDFDFFDVPNVNDFIKIDDGYKININNKNDISGIIKFLAETITIDEVKKVEPTIKDIFLRDISNK
ncbi:MAG: ATP-binding cassette domain-containing protein [Melioribacteraceae bacterium]|nr:ATP-binding cassette domain-containing protein [Melioribacteraceae bacterium]MCF8352823.1 ATP-binding cassette domain-containing protein [Melioribacteraceae bacterium]MCF8393457.1 ATP-binding cassette domain-containing protein [Melioribacteraceae bacterium]MCF8417340.1 ATP-binding cassette domain-containing protein [Melioribacteraceae bacterium]